jgi:phosphotriesterase-related protein
VDDDDSGTLLDQDSLLEFAKSGVTCELDLFGIETSHYELSDAFNMPSDAHRIQMLRWLLDDGRSDQIVISHDIHTKHRLVRFQSPPSPALSLSLSLNSIALRSP